MLLFYTHSLPTSECGNNISLIDILPIAHAATHYILPARQAFRKRIGCLNSAKITHDRHQYLWQLYHGCTLCAVPDNCTLRAQIYFLLHTHYFVVWFIIISIIIIYQLVVTQLYHWILCADRAKWYHDRWVGGSAIDLVVFCCCGFCVFVCWSKDAHSLKRGLITQNNDRVWAMHIRCM